MVMKVILYFAFEQLLSANVEFLFLEQNQFRFQHTRDANGEPNIMTVATDATSPARKTAVSRSGTTD